MPTQPDVRRLLKKQQKERQVTKVTHPFAKYDETGRLLCIVCNAPVKSEGIWQAHLGSTAHANAIQKLKQLKQQQALKRRATSPPPQEANKRSRMEKQDIELEASSSEEEEDTEMNLPTDFFDADAQDDVEEVEEEVAEPSNGFPAGFFDDPEEEARVQGTMAPEDQAQADLEKDVEMFNEAMIDVTKESKEAQEIDDETFWQERQFDLSMEQAQLNSRVDKLRLLRQSGTTTIKETNQEEENSEIYVELKSSVKHIFKSNPLQETTSVFDDESDEDSE